jgi:hypothetical protein
LGINHSCLNDVASSKDRSGTYLPQLWQIKAKLSWNYINKKPILTITTSVWDRVDMMVYAGLPKKIYCGSWRMITDVIMQKSVVPITWKWFKNMVYVSSGRNPITSALSDVLKESSLNRFHWFYNHLHWECYISTFIWGDDCSPLLMTSVMTLHSPL